eukprot:GFUD01012057.1.p1 GENE.GFUD01012057.1~~GFUD01012057.1.p1  ORF type:complete len:320 (-),score=98.08 GFUD01012057.1:212-1135(-)
MVKLQIGKEGKTQILKSASQIGTSGKEEKNPSLKTKKIPLILPVTIKDVRRAEENKKAYDILSALSSVLLFIGCLLILFSIKSVWNLKIENWRLIKENAALKKTVRDNVAVENFRDHIPSEEEILEFERFATVDMQDLSWSESAQIFWSSNIIPPFDMKFLVRKLADQIYKKKELFDQMEETHEVKEMQGEKHLKREERVDDFQEIQEREFQDNNIAKILDSKKQDTEEIMNIPIDEFQKIGIDGEINQEVMGDPEMQRFAEGSGVAQDFNEQIMEIFEGQTEEEYSNMIIRLSISMDVNDETGTSF